MIDTVVTILRLHLTFGNVMSSFFAIVIKFLVTLFGYMTIFFVIEALDFPCIMIFRFTLSSLGNDSRRDRLLFHSVLCATTELLL